MLDPGWDREHWWRRTDTSIRRSVWRISLASPAACKQTYIYPNHFLFCSVIGFVVSTIPELSMIVDLACQHKCKPFSDVLLGVPICKSKLSAIQKLKLLASYEGKNTIHILVDNPDQVDFVEAFIRNSSSPGIKWSVFIKVDTGYHRAGTTCDDEGVSLATKIIKSPYLKLKGLYSHW